MSDTSERRAIIDPFLLVLRSRRVLIALATLIIGTLVTVIPELAYVREELLTLIIALSLSLIGGLSIEDAARAGRERSKQPLSDDLTELKRELLREIVDEMFKREENDVQRHA